MRRLLAWLLLPLSVFAADPSHFTGWATSPPPLPSASFGVSLGCRAPRNATAPHHRERHAPRRPDVARSLLARRLRQIDRTRPRRLPRRVRRPDHRREMGLRRRRVVNRAAPTAHLQKVRHVHRRTPRHRTRRHFAPRENLGRRPALTPERPLGRGFVSPVTPAFALFRREGQEPAGFRATFHFPLAAPSVVVLS